MVYLSNQFQKILEWLTGFCAVVLVVIWPLSGTIALRNSALVLGSITSVLWLSFYRPKVSSSSYLPQLSLLAVPAWLWIHYFFIPTDPVAQWNDLTGTWLRVILGIALGTGLGLMASLYKRLQFWLWGAMIGLVVIALGMYFYEFVTQERLLIPEFKAIFKYKSALVYFLMWPLLLAYALLHAKFIALTLSQYLNLYHVMGIALLIIACWALFIASQALNGVLIAAFTGLTLFGIFIKTILIDRKTNYLYKFFLGGALLIILAGALVIFFQYDQKYEKKLTNLIDDINVTVKIESHSAWQRNPDNVNITLPINQYGKSPNGSTYERTSWFMKGAQLFIAHPEGSGFSHRAFRYFIHQENPQFDLTITHSGWLDFALGVGVPGIILTWMAMGLVVFRAKQSIGIKNLTCKISTSLITIWMIIGIWLLWWPAELSEREFIEHLYFMVAFLAGLNSRIHC